MQPSVSSLVPLHDRRQLSVHSNIGHPVVGVAPGSSVQDGTDSIPQEMSPILTLIWAIMLCFMACADRRDGTDHPSWNALVSALWALGAAALIAVPPGAHVLYSLYKNKTTQRPDGVSHILEYHAIAVTVFSMTILLGALCPISAAYPLTLNGGGLRMLLMAVYLVSYDAWKPVSLSDFVGSAISAAISAFATAPLIWIAAKGLALLHSQPLPSSGTQSLFVLFAYGLAASQVVGFGGLACVAIAHSCRVALRSIFALLHAWVFL